MNPDAAVRSLQNMKTFFDKCTGCFDEADAGFVPKDEQFTVAQQVAHVAQTVDWFVDGVFGGRGFDTNWKEHWDDVKAVKTLGEAREWWERAMKRAEETYGSKSAEELAQPIENDNLMGGAPRGTTVFGLADHTAHHRGSLMVYARLLGKEPPNPYA
jgi:uncharacterized damage-inducible protein DinB